jgi:hypothetical protein
MSGDHVCREYADWKLRHNVDNTKYTQIMPPLYSQLTQTATSQQSGVGGVDNKHPSIAHPQSPVLPAGVRSPSASATKDDKSPSQAAASEAAPADALQKLLNEDETSMWAPSRVLLMLPPDPRAFAFLVENMQWLQRHPGLSDRLLNVARQHAPHVQRGRAWLERKANADSLEQCLKWAQTYEPLAPQLFEWMSHVTPQDETCLRACVEAVVRRGWRPQRLLAMIQIVCVLAVIGLVAAALSVCRMLGVHFGGGTPVR